MLDKNIFWLLFNRMYLLFKSYFNSFSIKNMEEIIKQIPNVMGNCNNITYDEKGQSDAYAYMHFLDRYYRFQIIFKELFEQKVMPKFIKLLDVGTGPGPSLYCISDMYKYLKEVDVLKNLKLDYVEQSNSFRSFLHYFTEYCNMYTENEFIVPYHFGTFDNFKKINFNSIEYNSGGRQLTTVKHRYNFIIFSNFITQEDNLKQFDIEITNCIKYLKNKGLILFVGALSKNKNYRLLYSKIQDKILNLKLYHGKNKVKCVQINLPTWRFENDFEMRYIRLLKKNFSDLKQSNIKLFEKYPEINKKIEKYIEGEYKSSWEIMLFRKIECEGHPNIA